MNIGGATRLNPCEYAINRRRNEENRRAALVETTRENVRLDSIARWEGSAGNVARHQRFKNFKATEVEKRKADLERRRSKLAELLKQDAVQFRREIDAVAETTEERKARLMARANKLKNDRIERRNVYAEQMRRKQFRNNCDDLRANQGQTLLMNCSRIRKRQVEETSLIDKFSKNKDQKFLSMWESEYAEKLEREKLEERQKRELNAKTYEVVNKQIEEKRLNRERMAQRKTDEAEYRKAQTERETARAVLEMEEEHRQKNFRRQDAIAEAEQFRARLLAEKASEEAEDQKMVTRAQKELKEMAAKAGEKRAKELKDINGYLSYLERERAVEKEREAALEKLRNVDLQKEQAKRDERWERERLARENLLKSVYQERQEQIALKQMKNMKLHNRPDPKIIQQNREADCKDAQKNLDRHQKELAIQEYIQKQIQEKQLHHGRAREEVLLEKRRTDEAEGEFKKQLKTEMKKDLQAMKAGRSVHHGRKSANWWTF